MISTIVGRYTSQIYKKNKLSTVLTKKCHNIEKYCVNFDSEGQIFLYFSWSKKP